MIGQRVVMKCWIGWAAVVLCVMLTACSDSQVDSDTTALGRIADSRGRAASGNSDFAPGSAEGFQVLASLATSAGANSYREEPDTALLRGGTMIGRVEGGEHVAGDVVVHPTTDSTVCDPFTETIVPSDDRGVGNAVVWLVGVQTGPPNTAPRRVTLTLDRCQLQPRVQRMALGSSMLVKSRDAMTSQLSFSDIGRTNAQRTRIDFSDAGQVVPTGVVANAPGIVEVRDSLHPWLRAYVVVASHAFIDVTKADGEFRFDAVPPGNYTLVVWQEALGVRTRAVRITTGVETRIVVGY